MNREVVKYILKHLVEEDKIEEVHEYIRKESPDIETLVAYCVDQYKIYMLNQVEKLSKKMINVKDFSQENADIKVLAISYVLSELAKEDATSCEESINAMVKVLENFYYYCDVTKKGANNQKRYEKDFYLSLYNFAKISKAFDYLVEKLVETDPSFYQYCISSYQKKKGQWLIDYLIKNNLENPLLIRCLIDKQQLGEDGREGYERSFQNEFKKVMSTYVQKKSEEELMALYFNKEITSYEIIIWYYAIQEGKCLSLKSQIQSAFMILLKQTSFEVIDKKQLEYLSEQILQDEMPVDQFQSWVFDYRGKVTTHLFSIATFLFDELSEAKNLVLAFLSSEESGSIVLESWPQHALEVFLYLRKDILNIAPEKSFEQLVELKVSKENLYLQLWGGYFENSQIITKTMIEEVDFSKNQELIKSCLERSKDYKVAMKEAGYLEFLKIAIEWLEYQDAEDIVALLEHKQKKITNYIETVIVKNENCYREDIEKVYDNGKKRPKEIAERILKTWNNEMFLKPEFAFDEDTLLAYVEENDNPKDDKLLANIPEALFEGVVFEKSQEPVPTMIIKYLIKEYLLLKEVYRIGLCDKAIEIMNLESVQNVFKAIYHQWLDKGAVAKEKNMLLPYVIYMDTSDIIPFKNQLVEWNNNARGAIAAFGVGALAMNGSDSALMQVSSISKKFKNKKVRSEASLALYKAAEVLDISKDVLEDRIISNLGFDQRGEMTLSYGEREFLVQLSPELTIQITDLQRDKIIKTLPKPGVKDDEVIAKQSKKHLTDIKKQLKEIVKIQKQRLEGVLINGRKWDKEGWYNLFAKNPIMHNFATGLIWGVYDEADQLMISLRYMDDGTFNTVDEEDYELEEKAKLTLVHPCEISQELLQQWQECLEDYEIIQPLIQLGLPVFEIDDDLKEAIRLNGYDKFKTTYGKVIGMKTKYNWQSSVPKDGGGLEYFYILEESLDVEIFFVLDIYNSEFYIGASPEETGIFNGVYFAEKNALDPSDYYDEEKLESKAYKIKEVKPRIVQMTLYQVSQLS